MFMTVQVSVTSEDPAFRAAITKAFAPFMRRSKWHDGRVSYEDVRRLLDYDPRTGIFRWKVARHGHAFKGYEHGHVFAPGTGPIAGLVKKRGHVEIKLFGRRFMAHRLAWLWMTGLWPKDEIDHRDLNPGNNAWENLREATGQQNRWNRYVQSGSSSGLKGVRQVRVGRWIARAWLNKKPSTSANSNHQKKRTPPTSDMW